MIDPKTLEYIERLSAKATTWRNICFAAVAYAGLMTGVAAYLAWRFKL